jgi:hypothetical protein
MDAGGVHRADDLDVEPSQPHVQQRERHQPQGHGAEHVQLVDAEQPRQGDQHHAPPRDQPPLPGQHAD